MFYGFFFGSSSKERKAHMVAGIQPITVACMIKAMTAAPGLSFIKKTIQGKAKQNKKIKNRFMVDKSLLYQHK